MAKLISTALDHELKYDDDEADPYVTPQQLELRCRKVEELWGKFYEPHLNEEIPAKDGELVVAYNEEGVILWHTSLSSNEYIN